MVISVTQLRSDLYRLIDKVIASGEPLEIERNGSRVEIAKAAGKVNLNDLPHRPEAIIGDPEELVLADFTDEWRP